MRWPTLRGQALAGVVAFVTALLASTASPAAALAPDPNIPCPTADSAGAAPYAAQVPAIEHEIASRVGAGFPDPVYIELNTVGTDDIYTTGCQGGARATSTVDSCAVHIEPDALKEFGSAGIDNILIHELVHCLGFEHFGAAYGHMPDWYADGSATWAQSVLGSSSGVKAATLSKIWGYYLKTPQTPLFSRVAPLGYDAVGFFVHLAETGTDPWHVIMPIGAALLASGNSNIAGWEAAAPTTEFLNSWGSGLRPRPLPGLCVDQPRPEFAPGPVSSSAQHHCEPHQHEPPGPGGVGCRGDQHPADKRLGCRRQGQPR